MSKITAMFGADVGELEAKMLTATRATKAYERAVAAVDGKKAGGDFTANLAKQNEAIAKATNLLRGGAIGAGVGMIIGKMKEFASAAEAMGDKATVAQKSAAKWGKEFEEFAGSFTKAGASVLGTLAGWGRAFGDSFRSPMQKGYDAVAESSEKAAKRQEEALKKSKEAHAKAAAEIPELLKKLEGEKRETEMSALGEYGRLLTEQYETEKRLTENAAGKKNEVTKAEAIKLTTELEVIRRKRRDLEAKLNAEDASAAAKLAAEQKSKAEKLVADEASAAAKIADLKYQKAWDAATNEQRLTQLVKEGREALADFEKDNTNKSLLRVEELRLKYEDLKKTMAGEKGVKLPVTAAAAVASNYFDVSGSQVAGRAMSKAAYEASRGVKGGAADQVKGALSTTEGLLSSIDRKLEAKPL